MATGASAGAGKCIGRGGSRDHKAVPARVAHPGDRSDAHVRCPTRSRSVPAVLELLAFRSTSGVPGLLSGEGATVVSTLSVVPAFLSLVFGRQAPQNIQRK